MNTWIPRSKRHRPDSEYGALYDGIPKWLLSSILGWLEDLLVWRDRAQGKTYYSEETLLEMERKLRITLSGDSSYDKFRSLLAFIESRSDHELALDILDFVLHHHYELETDDRKGHELEQILAEGGSAWIAVKRDGRWGLEERVAGEVATAAEAVMSAEDRAALHLRLAWSALYGRSPNPSSAYQEAVRAVESAAKPVVSPNNERATLGTMIRDLEQAPQNWHLAPQPRDLDAIEGLIAMMKLLWKSQYDRHGTDDDSIPIQVGSREAEAAVHLAVTLVHWFRERLVDRS